MAGLENNTQRKQADAFLNLTIEGKDGIKRNLSKGIALYLTNRLDKSIINACNENPEKFNELMLEGKVTAHVHVPGPQSDEDIAL